jgi:PAS domain S-box-containing protein
MLNIFKISGNPNESIQDVKKQLLFWILILINILGIPVVITGLIEAFILKQTLAAISYLIFFSPVLFVTVFRNRLSFKINALVLILCLYGIGVFNLIIYGFSGAAIPIFFAFLVFTSIFFNTKSAFIGIIFCVLAMIIIGFLFVKNFISLEIPLTEISTQSIAWVTAISVLIFLGSLIILSFSVIQKKTLFSLQFSKQQAADLEKLNLQLKEDDLKRKQAVEELKEKTSFIDSIIDSSALSMWISDEKGTLIRANPACLEFFGATGEEVIGKYNLFKDSVIEERGFMPDIRKVFEKGEVVSIVIDYNVSDVEYLDVKKGSHKILKSIFTPIFDSKKKVSNVIVQTIDLTEIKKAEMELKKHRDNLEELVKDRTKELEVKNEKLQKNVKELERYHKLFVDREFRIKELRDKVEELKQDKS